MSRYFVRPARMEDAAGIGRVHVDSWRVTYRGILPDAFLDGLTYEERVKWAHGRQEKPHIDDFVAVDREDDSVVGFVSLGPSREKNLVDVEGEIYAIYSRPGLQGKGIGWLLFEAGAAKLKERGFKNFFASVFSANARAIEFYKKVGGELIGHDRYVFEGTTHKTDTYFWKFTP